MKIEIGKSYVVGNGRKGEVVASYYYLGSVHFLYFIRGKTNEQKMHDAIFSVDASGKVSSSVDNSYDLIAEWKEPRKGVHYINVYDINTYPDTNHNFQLVSHKSRKEADMRSSIACRLARIRVEWTEGQFDE